ncbi:MAG: hypothetical protein JXJ22_18090 [Bacteroidales bacterium]|nr:hypothetical protein [Bacteroidales bacterium]
MKIVRLICTLIIVTNLSYSQEAKLHLIELDYTSVKPLEIIDRNFFITELIDYHADTTISFGKVRKGAFNKIADVGFKHGLATTFKNYLTFQTITKPLTEESVPTIMVVKNVSFNERVENGSEIASVIVEIEYLNSNRELIYSTLTKDSFNGMEVTPHHEVLLQHCINESLQLFNFIDKKTTSSLHKNSGSFPILTETPKIGFYGSFIEFRNNCPAFSYDYIVYNREGKKYKNRGNTEELKLEIVDSTFKFDQEVFLSLIYGFSDGEKIYINDKADGNSFGFNEIIPTGQYTVFQGTTTGMNGSAIAVGVVVGGLIGGAIAGAISSSGTRGTFILDLATGETYYFNNENLDYIIDQYPEVDAIFEKQPDRRKYEMQEYWIDQLNNYIEKTNTNKGISP